MGETKTLPRFTDDGRESYMLIHKRPVGPKTAERLFSLYEQYTRYHEYRMQYVAGWTALEASMVGTDLDATTRIQLVDAAKDSWEYALQLKQEHAANSAWYRGITPATVGEYRIATALATIGVFRELPLGKPSLDAIANMHSSMVNVMMMNDADMRTAQRHRLHGRAAEHKGLITEQLAMCAVNRLFSSRVIAIPSFARSDSGLHYPDQTHDIQILYMDRGKVTEFVPSEVKSRRSGKAFDRYVRSGLVFGEEITQNGAFSLSTQVARFVAELNDTIEPYDEFMLKDVTDSVMHSIRHYKRPEVSGIHCRVKRRCTLDEVVA
ncbi:TPA: hypothetical protein DCF80_02420 [Candidatus Saccharibacteria bacterium]|nr:hypothetical protein [Candidatus Saccharibacteria bacterium]HRK41054.1 hypothetical protein [Candidatus Saccharibacteria bacterium]